MGQKVTPIDWIGVWEAPGCAEARLVHFFAGSDHQIVHGIPDIGPATVELDTIRAGAVPRNLGSPQRS